MIWPPGRVTIILSSMKASIGHSGYFALPAQRHGFRWPGLCLVFFAVLTSQVLQAAEAGISPGAEPVNTQNIAIRTVPAMQLFTAKHRMKGSGISPQTQGFATRLGMNLIKAGGERDGPLHILFETRLETDGQKQELLLAFPSRGNPRSSGRYRAIRTDPFYCSYASYQGPASGIADAWAGLVKATRDAGYKTNGEGRYVFSCDGECSAEHTSVELQLGIE